MRRGEDRATGKTARISGSARDVTEFKRAQEANRQSEARYRSLLENMHEGVAYCRIIRKNGRPCDFTYLEVNAAFARLTGLQNVRGMKVSEITPEICCVDQELFELCGRVAAGGPPERAELRLRAFDVHFAGTVYSPAPEHFVAVFEVITKKRRTEQALKESEEKFRGLFDGISEDLQYCELVFDLEGKPTDIAIIDINPAFERHSGLRREQVVGRRVKEIWPALEQAWLDRYGAMVLTGVPIHFEEYSAWQGLWLEVRANPMGGNRFVAIVRDITSRKQIENGLRAAKAEAERANNAKSRFLAAASHDLRQPLSALSIYVGVLGTKLAPASGALLANMKDCVAHLSEMLSNLLDLSKLDAGVVAPEVSDFALDAILTKVASAHAPEAKLKGLALRCGYFGLIGRTDAMLFQRIISNLVANAIRYTVHGGVLVGCRRLQGKMWVEVWDTGIGIPADKTAEIFEEFRQLGNYERNRAKGTGLGLAIVAKTAALLGLQVRVQSRPGKGSLFAVELPLGTAVRSVVQRPYAHRPLRIALVEDNADVAAALAYSLRHFGHDVVAAASRSDLLLRLDGVAPDIVISDYRLAGEESGFDVIAAVRMTHGANLPAIVITGDTDPQIIRSMAEAGVGIQHKPLGLDVLRAAIAEATAARG